MSRRSATKGPTDGAIRDRPVHEPRRCCRTNSSIRRSSRSAGCAARRGYPDRRACTLRARSGERRCADAGGNPLQPSLRHASGHMRRGGSALCRHHGGDGTRQQVGDLDFARVQERGIHTAWPSGLRGGIGARWNAGSSSHRAAKAQRFESGSIRLRPDQRHEADHDGGRNVRLGHPRRIGEPARACDPPKRSTRDGAGRRAIGSRCDRSTADGLSPPDESAARRKPTASCPCWRARTP